MTRRRIVLGTAGGSALMLAFFGLYMHSRTSRTPYLVFEETSSDVGRLKFGEVAEHTFKLRNSGDGGLAILRVVPDCNCTVATSSTTEVPPGGTGHIVVQVHTETLKGFPVGFDAESAPISISKDVTVVTNDPEEGIVTLKILAKVEREFLFSGEHFIDFGKNHGGKGTAKEVMIRALGEARLTSIRSSDPAVMATLEIIEHAEYGTLYQIRAVQSSNFAAGEHQGNLTVSTSSRFLPRLVLPVRGTVVPLAERAAGN